MPSKSEESTESASATTGRESPNAKVSAVEASGVSTAGESLVQTSAHLPPAASGAPAPDENSVPPQAIAPAMVPVRKSRSALSVIDRIAR